jgi:hypothetical protein
VSTPLRERPDAPLGTLIFRAGLLPAETIESALEEGVKTGKRLGEILTERGLISEVDLARLLAGQKGLDFVTLREQIVDPSAATLFTEEQARLFRALPYSFDGELPVVAIADPTDEVLMRNIREALGRDDARFVVSARGELAEIAADVYARNPAPAPTPEPMVMPEPAHEPELSVEPEPAPAEPAEPTEPTEHLNGSGPADAELLLQPPAPEPAAEAVPEPQPAFVEQPVAPEPAPYEPPAAEQPVVAEPVAEQPVVFEPVAEAPPVPEPAYEPAPAPAPEPPAAFEPPVEPTAVEPAPVSEPVAAFEPAVEPEPAFEPAPVVEPEPQLHPEPVQAAEPVPTPPVAEPAAAAEPIPLPQPDPAPPAPPYPPAAEAPEPPVEMPAAPAAPEPEAVETHEPTAPSGVTWRLTVRLTNGESVDAGDFADQEAAKQEAKAVMMQVADDSGDWPFVSGRFLKPDTIVSVDIVELSGDAA